MKYLAIFVLVVLVAAAFLATFNAGITVGQFLSDKKVAEVAKQCCPPECGCGGCCDKADCRCAKEKPCCKAELVVTVVPQKSPACYCVQCKCDDCKCIAEPTAKKK